MPVYDAQISLAGNAVGMTKTISNLPKGNYLAIVMGARATAGGDAYTSGINATISVTNGTFKYLGSSTAARCAYVTLTSTGDITGKLAYSAQVSGGLCVISIK